MIDYHSNSSPPNLPPDIPEKIPEFSPEKPEFFFFEKYRPTGLEEIKVKYEPPKKFHLFARFNF